MKQALINNFKNRSNIKFHLLNLFGTSFGDGNTVNIHKITSLYHRHFYDVASGLIIGFSNSRISKVSIKFEIRGLRSVLESIQGLYHPYKDFTSRNF